MSARCSDRHGNRSVKTEKGKQKWMNSMYKIIHAKTVSLLD